MKFTKTYDMPASKVAYKFTVNIDITDPVATVAAQSITESNSTSGVVVPDVVVPPGRNNLIVDNPFATTNPFNGFNIGSGVAGRIVQLTNSLINPVGKYVSVRCDKTDPPYPVGSTNRSELSRPSNAEPFKQNTLRWYGIRYYFPTGYVNDPSAELIWQQHEYSGSASPHFALWTENGHIWVAINGAKDYDLGAYPLNTWISFVMKVNFSSSSTGVIELWRNDVKLIGTGTPKSYVGANMPATDSYLPYLKFGIYKWQWIKSVGLSNTTTRTLYVDQIRIGNNLAVYNDVKPDA